MFGLAFAIPYILVLAAGGTVWLARQYRRRRQPGAVWFSRALEACAIWMLLHAAAFLLPSPALQEFARHLIWPVAVWATLSFFRFGCAYSQRSSWWARIRAPVFAAIAVEIVLMLTNRFHSLMWHASEWVDFGAMRVPKLVPGAAFFWLHVPVCYGLFLGSVLALIVHATESQTFYGRRVVVLITAMLIPFSVNVLVIGQMMEGIDLTPLALALSFVILASTTFRQRLLDVMPAARSLLFRQHRDAVIVVDTALRVVDANPAVGRMLGIEATPGASIATLLPFWEQVRDLGEREGGGSIEVAHAGAVLEIRSLLMRDERATAIGRLIVLHDVTERARLVRELDAYARTVAHDLKNPLGGAIGYLDIVRADEPDLDKDSDRILGQAYDTCLRMVGIIADLLRKRPKPSET